MKISVESYSGYKGEERPARFFISDKVYEVKEIVDRWYSPGCRYFKVLADDGSSYILKYSEVGDSWELTFYQKY
jgi:hypothetical protein